MISAEVAAAKGLKYFETMPDGRAILDFGMLRVLGSVAEVELVGSSKALKEMIKEQEASGLYNQPEVEDTTVADDTVTDNGEVADNGESTEGEAVVETEEPASEEPAEDETVAETETNNEEELNNE